MAKKDEKLDWFPLYVYEFITDIAGWRNADKGVYFTLLCYQWINGNLPGDLEGLARMSSEPIESFKLIWENIGSKFTISDDKKHHNLKLEKIRLQQQKLVESKSEGGKKGAAERWGTVIMPFDSPTFKDAWSLWKRYKKTEHRFQFKSSETEQIQLNKLVKLSNNDEAHAIDLIINAIESTWKGFYPLQKNYGNKRHTSITAAGIIDSLQSRYK